MDASGAGLEVGGQQVGATRLGFSTLLKFFEIEGRFPEYAAEVPERAVSYLTEQVKVDPALFAKYEFSSRAAKYHRMQIREELRFRECTRADQVVLAEWLSRELCSTELRREQLRDAVIARSRAERMEPPTFGQIARLVNSAVRAFEEWGWIPRRFDPSLALATPCSIRALIGPDPRVIADDVWAKLLWAGLNLEHSDIYANPVGRLHPIELLRALALTWLFAGLRSDEIVRLRVGCVRWQRDGRPPFPATPARSSPRTPSACSTSQCTRPGPPSPSRSTRSWGRPSPPGRPSAPPSPPSVDRKTGEQVAPAVLLPGARHRPSST